MVATVSKAANIKVSRVSPAAPGHTYVKRRLISEIGHTIVLRRITQAEAARLCGTDAPTLSKILRGRLGSVTIDTLAAWLSALGRPIEIRIGESSSMCSGRVSVTVVREVEEYIHGSR
jgi:predicted XRE-type DNA-binding protein